MKLSLSKGGSSLSLHWTKFVGLAAAVALSGCVGLPAPGPSVSSVVQTDRPDAPAAPYVLVELDAETANIAGQYRPPGFSSFKKLAGTDPRLALQPGDVVSVNIFEAGADGLFSSSEVKSAQLQTRVDQAGRIFVPYVGAVNVQGRSTEAVRAEIQRELEDKAIQPQVQLDVVESVANTATVLGAVRSPGQLPILMSGVRVLDVVANAGGTSAATYNTEVTLRRGHTVATANLEDIFDKPEENVPVRPGDTLLLSEVLRSFTILGATGNEAEVAFGARRVTLAEALGRAEGLDGEFSDPRGVFLFRFEEAHIAKALSDRAGVAPDGSKVPVIYRLNFADPNSLFVSQLFEMRNEDVLYVADHPTASFAKFLQIISPAISAANTIIAVSTRLTE